MALFDLIQLTVTIAASAKKKHPAMKRMRSIMAYCPFIPGRGGWSRRQKFVKKP